MEQHGLGEGRWIWLTACGVGMWEWHDGVVEGWILIEFGKMIERSRLNDRQRLENHRNLSCLPKDLFEMVRCLLCKM